MRDKLWLLIAIGKAAMMPVVAVFALALILSRFVVPSAGERVLAAWAFLLPSVVAAWWLFHKLQTRFTKREARALSISFGILAPVWLGISMLLGELSGGYASFLGSAFGFAGAFAGVVATATLVSFALCLLTLLITRHVVRLEPAQD